YSIEWSQQASTVPDMVKDTSGSSSTSPSLADGQWWFHLRTRDNAGNWSGAVHLGPFRIDATPPSNPTVTSSSHTPGQWSNDPTVDVTWAGAGGGGSGIHGASVGSRPRARTGRDTAHSAPAP